ncbi:hypothetical protein Pint_13161 [Pistacia integerrima]|uniref:Uncharacterized protein n=1 Tax=Pistacia integerrima TaxID=434235 RepID=A0ACC0Y5H9_9ROSI|nr:hypothetical protein Pint_13161 [Pistacia integerrima]
MGATLAMVVSLAIVLGLILVLLVELYCSLLLRRRQLRNTTSNTTTTINSIPSQPLQTQDRSASPLASPPTSFITSPQPIQETPLQVGTNSSCRANEEANYGGDGGEDFVYISNPIYDNDASRLSRADTPFETPDTSPSRLETGGSSGEASSQHSLPITPPLTPMKKLPAEACSVSLRDARSLGPSRSDSVSNNGLSSSSSGSPCTSPSW